MTPNQEWHRERDRAILCLRALGWTLRRIGFVFDVPPSRIHAIAEREKSERAALPELAGPERPCYRRSGRVLKKPIPDD